jgi:hypothetical protein
MNEKLKDMAAEDVHANAPLLLRKPGLTGAFTVAALVLSLMTISHVGITATHEGYAGSPATELGNMASAVTGAEKGHHEPQGISILQKLKFACQGVIAKGDQIVTGDSARMDQLSSQVDTAIQEARTRDLGF